MKKIISILLAITLLMSGLIIGNFAADNTQTKEENAFVTVEPNEGEVCFSVGFAEPGKAIKAYIAGREDETFFYKWYLDNVQINDFSDSYTPTESDYEKILTVKIYDTDCELIGVKSMLISPLPVVYIEVDDRQPIVDKVTQLDAHMTIQGNSEYSDSSVLYDGKTQIKGRGNTTWDAPKKPYKLKLDSKADLFGMGKSKHWVLLSNPYDSSNMRNAVSYKLADDMGLSNQSCVWVELVLNGKFVGLYQLCEHVRIDSNRVDITNWDDIAEDAAKAIYKKNTNKMTKDERDELVDIMTADMNWVTSDNVTYKGNTYTVSDYYKVPSINGGYLLEVDWHETNLAFRTPSNANVAINKPEGIGADMFNYIKGYYLAFETALFADDFCTEYEGKKMRYSDFIDMESFVKGLLINEIFENFDFGLNSTYVSKDIDGKLVFGPVWDMDYTTVSAFTSWTTAKKAWLKRLLSDPVFMEAFREEYFKYRYTDIQDVIKDGGDIDKAIEKIYTSSVHNDKLWNNSVKFELNALDFKWRLQTKINWLDSKLETLDSAFKSFTSGTTMKAINNSKEIALSFDEETLNMSFTTLPSSVSVFADGELFETFGPEAAECSIDISGAEGAKVYTVVAYNASGKVISGNYITAENYVTNLTASLKSDEQVFKVGESLDKNDFELTASFADGTVQTVESSLIYTYTKDALGTQFFCQDKVTDKIGDVYAVFMYGNAKTEIKLNIAPRNNSEEIEQMIAIIPSEGSDPQFTRTLFEAKIAYDALSSEAKAQVGNAAVLNERLAELKRYTGDPGTSIFDCYIDGAARKDSKDNVLVVAKYVPRRIVFEYSEGGTSSYTKTSEQVISVKQINTVPAYEIWTINQSMTAVNEYYTVRAAYPGSPVFDDYHITSDALFGANNDFVKADISDTAWLGEDYTINAQVNDRVSEIKVSENGTDISAEFNRTENTQSLTFKFTEAGKHSLTMSCLKNGIWFEYKTFDVYVREPVETGKIFYSENLKNSYSEKTTVKFITDDSIETVALSSGEEIINLECVVKNGYKIFTGEVIQGKDYNVSVDGTETDKTVSSVRLGDVNLDGQINSYDALRVLQFATEMNTPDEGEAIRADINEDGTISSYDALLILQISTGMLTTE